MRAGAVVSTLDAIRARVENGQGGDTLTAADRATLLALLAAQSLELQAVRKALEDYGMHGYGCLIGHYNPNTDGPHDCTCGLDAALKQSRGAT